MSDEPRQPTYRDAELMRLFKALRATVKPYAGAKAALERVETRLRYVLRIIEQWDKTHSERAEFLIRMGCTEAANTHAAMIFDADVRAALYRRCFVGGDGGAEERVLGNAELDREVLL